MSREGTEEGPLRSLGWGSSHRRGRSHYHSCLMTQTRALCGQEPHALPPPQACPPHSPPKPFPSWLGPSDPKQTLARDSAPEQWCACAGVLWGLAVGEVGTCLCCPTLVGRGTGWGRPGELGRVGTRGSAVTHPQADNARAGVGKSSSAHRGDPGSARVLPQAPCHARVPQAQEWLHPRGLVRPEGLGGLLLTLPTAGRSDLGRREEAGRAGRGVGRDSMR